MKQILMSLVVLLLMDTVLGNAQVASITVSPSGQRISVDSSATVRIFAQNVMHLHAYSIQLWYNSQMLRCMRVTSAQFLGTLTFFSRQIDTLNGRINIDEAVLGPSGNSGSGDLLEIQFKGLRAGDAPLELHGIDLRDTVNQKVSSTAQGGMIQVGLTTAVEEGGTHESRILLTQNYPNPFNPTTTIRYRLPDNGIASVHIYSLLGDEVLNVSGGYQQRGEHAFSWNGQDNAGRDVPTGVYIFRVEARGSAATARMMLIR